MPNTKRLFDLYNEAKGVPSGAAREEFLTASCEGDVQLRQRLRALLQADELAGDFLKPAELDSTVFMPGESVGDLVGRYKLMEKIGEGGCGVVYMAEQKEPVRRRVALKVIKLGMDTKQVIARFEAERQALAMMDHPNIAKVLDAGATEAGRPFFVMELVRGIKITDFCDQANVSTKERLQLFIQVCQATQHAHQKGIIHRDIKPSNVLVTLHDGVPVSKVIDFGVAKATQQQRLTDLTVYTQFEQMVGTPLYMSPEQAEMSGLDIDTRSDIYSLGVLLYELLTGRTPFDPAELMRQGLDEIRRTIREQEPQKPSTFVQTMALELRTGVARHRQADGTRLAGMIRGDLDWIVMKAIEKDRARRYETANALAADLQRHLRHEPVTARPASASYRFRRMIRRNKLAFAAVTAVSVALLVGTGVSTWMFLKEKSARERAVAAERTQSDLRLAAEQARTNEIQLRHKAEAEAARSERHDRFMKRMWMDLSSRRDGSNTAIFRDILDQSARRVIKELHFEPESEAELRGEIASGFRDVGSYANSEAMFAEALSLRKKMHGELHVEVARALQNLADVLRLEGKDAEAIPVYRHAIEMRRQLLGNEHVEVAESLFGLAEVSGRFGETDALREAEDSARECLRIREHEMPGDWLTFATRSVLGGCLLRQEKYAEAELLLAAAYYGMKAHESQMATAVTAGNFRYLAAVPRIAVTDAHPRVPAIQLAVHVRKQQAAESLVALFEATGRPTEAAACKQQLEELQTPESKK